MGIEKASLSAGIMGVQAEIIKYQPLRIVNGINNFVEKTCNTPLKKALSTTLSGVATVAAIKVGTEALGLSGCLGVWGGTAIGSRVHFISVPERFFRKRKTMQRISEEDIVPVKEIARLLIDYPDKVEKAEVERWFDEQMGEKTHEHPERYHLMKAVRHNNSEPKEVIMDKFMRAQDIALRLHESKTYQRKIADEKILELGISIAVLTGSVGAVAFLFGHPEKAGWVGAIDDIIYFAFNAIDFIVDRVESFLKSPKD